MSLERLRDSWEAPESKSVKKLQIFPSEEPGCKVGPLFARRGSEREIVFENPSERPKNTANVAAGRGPCEGL